MLDALIFDFDGVIVDSEPIHLAAFRAVLLRRGLTLSTQDYYAKYLGYDDHDCFSHVLLDQGREADETEIAAMTAEKTVLVQCQLAQSSQALPGAVELMRQAKAAGAGLAICSGALREEILIAGRAVGAVQLVDVLVAARDVQRGKPDPEGYLLARRLLGEKFARPIRSAWVVEDSPAGIEAAKGAGCRVLAVTNSYSSEALRAADRIVQSLATVDISDFGFQLSD